MKNRKLFLGISALALLAGVNGSALQTSALGGGFDPVVIAERFSSSKNMTIYDVYEDGDSGAIVRDKYQHYVFEFDDHSNLVDLKSYEYVDDGSGDLVETIGTEIFYTYNENNVLVKEETIVYDGDFDHFEDKYIYESNDKGLQTGQSSYNWDNGAFVLESFCLYSYEMDTQLDRPTKLKCLSPNDLNDFDVSDESTFSVTSYIKYSYDNDNQTDKYNVEEFFDAGGNCQGKNTYTYDEAGRLTSRAEYMYMDEYIYMNSDVTEYNENGDIVKISHYRNEPTNLDTEEIYEYNELGYLTSYCYCAPESIKDYENFVLDEHGRIIGGKKAYYEWQDDHYELSYSYDVMDFEIEHTPFIEPNNNKNNGFNWWWLLIVLAVVVTGGVVALILLSRKNKSSSK